MPAKRGDQGPSPHAADLTWEQRVRRRQDLRRRRRRRRLGWLGVGLATLVVSVTAVLSGTGGPSMLVRKAQERPAALSRPAPPILLPRGGRVMLPGHLVVAYYGIVGTSNILGHTRDPETDAAGVEHAAETYARFGLPVQPAFELVTTIASPSPGLDGTYSSPVDPVTLKRYLNTAHRHKLLLILDFQPGRGEFLPQVRRYAHFLLDPSVGVALDPEWKLTADQVPDQVIGSSSAASINAVSAYLSGLVTAHRLPQKLLIVHQFRPAELPDRQNIQFRTGLATVLQMDGLGSVATKLAAYHQVQRGARPFRPGFKVFLRRSDDPVLMTPQRIMKLPPRPEYISYQ